MNWFPYLLGIVMAHGIAQAQAPGLGSDGLFRMPAVALPPPSLLSDEGKIARQSGDTLLMDAGRAIIDEAACGHVQPDDPAASRRTRDCQAKLLYATAFYKDLRARHPVTVTTQMIGGVYTEIFTPANGVSANNRNRVLINLHGGGFQGGSRTTSHVESIPIADAGRIKVVSIDYRLAPEFRFPAGSEDVEAVYRAMLKDYKPEQIGIYGCSAGAVLAAEAIARFVERGLPVPGGAGLFCSGAARMSEGDSGQFWKDAPINKEANPYFQGAREDDPLAFPIRSPAHLSRFPPTLVITGTRDFALSSAVATHQRLVALGVDADLHVWDGLGHGFFMDHRLPESREVHSIVTKFFDRHLSR